MIHYKVYMQNENAEWVTFVHGAGGSSSIWHKQIKPYKEHFNILLVDLRGHGKSKDLKRKTLSDYTFSDVGKDIVDVLNHLQIASSHFVCMSLGTIIAQSIAAKHPTRIRSMVLGGAVTRLNIRSQVLITLGNLVKHLVPYMWLYRLFAWVIMPYDRHRESRSLFVREAKKLCQKEFKRWFKLTRGINAFLQRLLTDEPPIPTLYIMGEEDYMFLPAVQVRVGQRKFSQLHLVADSGHVVNVDQPEEFNRHSIRFLQEQKALDRVG